MSEIIGEGTYGCVSKPSIRCADNSVLSAYKNKVSKIMLNKYAKREMKEWKKISTIPGIDRFTVPFPKLCKPKLDRKFHRTLKKCRNSKFPDTKLTDFRLLVLEDGGVDLDIFMKTVVPTMTIHDANIFWARVLMLLEGLCFFHQNGIIHHDIKSLNIVYNIQSAAIKFIDFGLMKTRKEMIQSSTKNTNLSATTWFNYPPEYYCANQKKYLSQKCPYKMEYSTFISLLTDTFDSFSFGICFEELINDFIDNFTSNDVKKSSELLEFLKDSAELFQLMGKEDVELRTGNVYLYRDQYKSLLEKHSMTKYFDMVPAPSKKMMTRATKLLQTKKKVFKLR
jgi:serine/threonine protein kinase